MAARPWGRRDRRVLCRRWSCFLSRLTLCACPVAVTRQGGREPSPAGQGPVTFRGSSPGRGPSSLPSGCLQPACPFHFVQTGVIPLTPEGLAEKPMPTCAFQEGSCVAWSRRTSVAFRHRNGSDRARRQPQRAGLLCASTCGRTRARLPPEVTTFPWC